MFAESGTGDSLSDMRNNIKRCMLTEMSRDEQKGAKMVQLDEMLDRLDMESLVFRLMYGTIYNGGYTGSYEDRINSAYEKFMEEIKQHYSSDTIVLEEMLNRMVTTYADTYFEMGLIVGYTMYKKQSEKAVETGLDDVAGEILAKVESAGQLKESR